MNAIIDIEIKKILFGLLLFGIPIIFLFVFRVSIVKGLVISIIRMVVQLSMVALYLEWIFEKNNAYINSLWVLIMIITGLQTTIKRASLSPKYFMFPLFIAGLTSVIIIDAFFLGFIIRLEYIFEARYFIPITGMVLGNSLNYNIIGLSSYIKGLKEKKVLYEFLLTNSGDMKMALKPFIGEAIKNALNPLIATMSVIGLISLPGMMTGQILGGTSPSVAIKYQIMIMTAIFSGCAINLFLSIIFINRFVFDEYGNLTEDVLKN